MKNFTLATALVLSMGISVLAQPAAIDLGTLTDVRIAGGNLAAGEVAWYRFDFEVIDVQDAFLDITTNFADEQREIADTELALYDDAGNVISSAGEDDGFGLQSTLSFGTGSGLPLGDSFNLGGDGLANGEHGAIASGTYYVAVGGFETVFTDDWQATSLSPLTGTYQLTFYPTNFVPEPSAAMILLGLLGVLALRRH